MALQHINPIGLPIEETYETDIQISKNVRVWGGEPITLSAYPYQGFATIRFNGAVMHHFADVQMVNAEDQRIMYDQNISVQMQVDNEIYWVTRAAKPFPKGIGILSHITPRATQEYPLFLSIVYCNDNITYKDASILIDGVEVYAETGVEVLTIDVSNVASVKLEAIRVSDNVKEEYVWNAGGITYLVNNIVQNNGIYVTGQSSTQADGCTPLHVRWINMYGGYDYWTFTYRKRLQRKVTAIDTYGTYSGGGQSAILRHGATEQVGASTGIVTRAQADALAYLLYSPQITYYNEELHAWQQINIQKNATHVWDTDQPTGEMIFTFDLPTPQLVI